MEMLEAFLRVEDGDVLLYGVLDILSLLLGMIRFALQSAAARGVVQYVQGDVIVRQRRDRYSFLRFLRLSAQVSTLCSNIVMTSSK